MLTAIWCKCAVSSTLHWNICQFRVYSHLLGTHLIANVHETISSLAIGKSRNARVYSETQHVIYHVHWRISYFPAVSTTLLLFFWFFFVKFSFYAQPPTLKKTLFNRQKNRTRHDKSGRGYIRPWPVAALIIWLFGELVSIVRSHKADEQIETNIIII